MSLDLDRELEALGIPAVQTAPPAAKPEPPRAVTNEVHPLAANWSKWKDRFAEAMDDGFYTVEQLEKLIFSNHAQLWCGNNAAIVTKIENYEGGARVLQAIWMAGDLAEAIDMSPGIESFGRSMGCTQALIEGRPGWVKLLKAKGYKPWSMTVGKAI